MENEHETTAGATLSSDAELDEWLHAKGGAIAGGRILEDGTVFGKFKILALIGRGGNAEVYRAEPIGGTGFDGPAVALKVVADGAGSSGERLRREAAVLRDHPHRGFPRFVESGDVGGRAFLAMEELSPGDLPRNPAGVFRFMSAVCGALSHLHGLGFVHRDVKPSNIMFRGDGSPVMIDLGLVKDTGKVR